VTTSGLQSQPNLPVINRNAAKKHVKSQGFLKKSIAVMQPQTARTISTMMHNINNNNNNNK